MLELAVRVGEAGQIVIVTPFILMGAMGPVSVPAALAQQTAEALAALTLVQLIRPGCPAIMGSFVSHTDMQSGSPGFGGPESAVGILATGQIARRYGLLGAPAAAGSPPRRSSTRRPPSSRSTRCCRRSWPAPTSSSTRPAGWSRAWWRASRSSTLDIEILRILQREFTPLEIDEESLAFDAHLEVGHGGHFFGAAHTLERFRDCFYRPQVFSTRELRALDALRQPRHRRPRREALAGVARALVAAAARRRHPPGAQRVRRAAHRRARRLTLAPRRGRARRARPRARRRRDPARRARAAGRPPAPACRSRSRPSPRR